MNLHTVTSKEDQLELHYKTKMILKEVFERFDSMVKN